MTGTFFVRGEDAEAVGRMCATFQDAKKLLSDIALATMDLWREDGMGKVEDAARLAPAAGTPVQASPSSASRQAKLEASRGKWKSKAVERHVELEKDRIKMRDLTASRDKWRGEALAARKTIGEAKVEIAKLKKNFDDAKKNSPPRSLPLRHPKNPPATPMR
jgi:hypothetical protein